MSNEYIATSSSPRAAFGEYYIVGEIFLVKEERGKEKNTQHKCRVKNKGDLCLPYNEQTQ